MNAIPSILIFDVGKTNKKIVLFDEGYNPIYEESTRLEEISDEDGYPCEDIGALSAWVIASYKKILADKRFEIRAVNFSAYGASLVYIDENGDPLLPLYNYLKPYPETLQEELHCLFGGSSDFARATASPVLGSLNSGLQLYRIKKEKPAIFAEIKYALHLPQYLSFLITEKTVSEITSIGCHTALWDFTENQYHEWVLEEGILTKLPPIYPGENCILVKHGKSSIPVGIGLHDSSAALIPYQYDFHEPFILLSTGTWCISLNPFNNSPLSQRDLEKDCLCYFTWKGKPVKASRLFAGYEHEQQAKRLAEYYGLPLEYFNKLDVNFEYLRPIGNFDSEINVDETVLFSDKDLSEFSRVEQAYHELIIDIVARQLMSTNLVLQGAPVKKLFVDGGFSGNSIYMHLMAEVFPNLEVFAASVPQASALGAALAIHKHWNNKQIPTNIITLKGYSDIAATRHNYGKDAQMEF